MNRLNLQDIEEQTKMDEYLISNGRLSADVIFGLDTILKFNEGAQMGVFKAKEVELESLKFVKAPNKFYKYVVRVIDLNEKDLPTNSRIKLENTSTIEVANETVVRDAILIKHALEIQNISDYETMLVEVDILKTWNIG